MKRILIVLVIAVTGMLIAYQMMDKSDEVKTPGFINPTDVDPQMVDSIMQNKGFGHRIGKFSFRNQDGQWVSDRDVQGKIYVAEYFFSTCSTICPKMNTQMKRIQHRFRDERDVLLLSFTVDPETDSIARLKEYADLMGAISGKWHFLTGAEKDLYQLARTSFFVLKPAEAQNQGDAGSDFIHTNNFVLIDQQGRIRGYYDGTSAKEVDQLMKDIVLLQNENE